MSEKQVVQAALATAQLSLTARESDVHILEERHAAAVVSWIAREEKIWMIA